KDAVDQARVPGNTAGRGASSPRNVRGGTQRVCNKSRLACDMPPWGTADRILQRCRPAPSVAGVGRSGRRNELVAIRLQSIDTVTRSRVSSSRTSRDRLSNCIHYLAFARCAVRSQIPTNRKDHACRDDVDPKCDRRRRGYCRLGEKVIAWEEFVCGRGGAWCL